MSNGQVSSRNDQPDLLVPQSIPFKPGGLPGMLHTLQEINT